jgi:small subunit ribosomal protein S8
MMTDPIADMFTRIRNAAMARKPSVVMPSSKIRQAIARILAREGYVASYRVFAREDRPGEWLEIVLKYPEKKVCSISGLRRVSKPGRRVYVKHEELPRVLGGMGIAIVSTSKGLLTDREARRRRLGGEVIGYVW